MEMQGIRMLYTTIWTENVREIMSAEDACVKFILTYHPVTIYNNAPPPEAPQCAFPHDPGIALKASQTLFLLSRDHCLILTNLEYAENPSVPPLEERTFARNFRRSMVRTDQIIRMRGLTDIEVSRINGVLKARAKRHIAAGRREWLYPEQHAAESWADMAATLLPPHDELWHVGGETYVAFEDGSVRCKDAFGRTEKEREALKKVAPTKELTQGAPCGCGSGHPYRICCQFRPVALRPSWTQRIIREGNLVLHCGILSILGLDAGKDWTAVRQELTDDQIKEVYFLYEALWPLETDLLLLLPKPDGRPRAVYTGSLHPQSIVEFAIGTSLYFGELIVETPFVHSATIAEKFWPTEHPRSYHLEFLKAAAFFLNVMSLVDAGLINLIPDPWSFDHHLRRETMAMAEERSAGIDISLREEPRLAKLMRTGFMRAMLTAPKDDTFDDGKEGGQMRLMQMGPNFEIAMYLAQATGTGIVTDSAFR